MRFQWITQLLPLGERRKPPVSVLAELLVRQAAGQGSRILLFGSPWRPTETAPLDPDRTGPDTGLLELWTRGDAGVWERLRPGLPPHLHTMVIQRLMALDFEVEGVETRVRLHESGAYVVELQRALTTGVQGLVAPACP